VRNDVMSVSMNALIFGPAVVDDWLPNNAGHVSAVRRDEWRTTTNCGRRSLVPLPSARHQLPTSAALAYSSWLLLVGASALMLARQPASLNKAALVCHADRAQTKVLGRIATRC
jgi:hypothetical protein